MRLSPTFTNSDLSYCWACEVVNLGLSSGSAMTRGVLEVKEICKVPHPCSLVVCHKYCFDVGGKKHLEKQALILCDKLFVSCMCYRNRQRILCLHTHTGVRITAGFVCMFGPKDERYPFEWMGLCQNGCCLEIILHLIWRMMCRMFTVVIQAMDHVDIANSFLVCQLFHTRLMVQSIQASCALVNWRSESQSTVIFPVLIFTVSLSEQSEHWALWLKRKECLQR